MKYKPFMNNNPSCDGLLLILHSRMIQVLQLSWFGALGYNSRFFGISERSQSLISHLNVGRQRPCFSLLPFPNTPSLEPYIAPWLFKDVSLKIYHEKSLTSYLETVEAGHMCPYGLAKHARNFGVLRARWIFYDSGELYYFCNQRQDGKAKLRKHELELFSRSGLCNE